MAFSEVLAERVRDALVAHPTVEKKMFGGLCFMVGGHMCAGVLGDTLMLRVGPDGWADALQQPHAREMDFTGRSLKGMIYVDPDGTEDDPDLKAWLQRALHFVGSLPPKKPRKPRNR